MKKAVIIVAGGKGTRMGTDVPKQFLKLLGIPVLCRTINCFLSYDSTIQVVLALPEHQKQVWEEIAKEFFPFQQFCVVSGGKERYHSVKNALDEIGLDVDLTAVHDGVRPLVSKDTISRCLEVAALKNNAVPCITPPESIRFIKENSNKPLDRNCVKLIQTPQIFSTKILKDAYQIPYNEHFTDDASVVEQFGNTINLVDGDKHNIKITTKEDLEYAEFLLRK